MKIAELTKHPRARRALACLAVLLLGAYGECHCDVPPGTFPTVVPVSVQIGGTETKINAVQRGPFLVWQSDVVIPQRPAQRDGRPRAATIELGQRWPTTTIPFEDQSNHPGLAAAFQTWQNATTLTFVAATAGDRIVFRSPTTAEVNEDLLCVSYGVGFQGGVQDVVIDSSCNADALVHEIGHAIGLFHEMSRTDRDLYIDVFWDNIDTLENWVQFTEKIPYADQLNAGPYDFASVMHYSSCDFSSGEMNNPCPGLANPGCTAPTIARKSCSGWVPPNAISTGDACSVLLLYDIAAYNARGCFGATPDCVRAQRHYVWSCNGPITGPPWNAPGYHCIPLDEPADPHWKNNHICLPLDAPSGAFFRWSNNGPISGMRCTQIYEGAEPASHTWNDNYICVMPASSGGVGSAYYFRWSQSGPRPGEECLQFYEPADPHTWNDNYLCWPSIQ